MLTGDSRCSLVFAILVGIAFLLKVKYIKTGMTKEVQRKASVGVLAVALGVMSFVGHDGGSLTHGEEYLFKYAPNWIRSIAGFAPKYPVDPSDDSQPVFHSIIKPFLENNCVECHGSAKMKGGLRLDMIDCIKKGGKNKKTPLIVHGKAEDSLLYQLMVIDDEDEIMPPDGKLEDPKIKLIKWWIDSSKSDADLYEKTIGESGIPEELRYILALKDPDLLRAVQYIKKNIDKQINVNTICQYISRSRRWLEYSFKKEMNLSPLEFITQTRVNKAKEFLSDSENFKLSAVAYMSGFSSTDQMNKAFKKFYSKSARHFRAGNGNVPAAFSVRDDGVGLVVVSTDTPVVRNGLVQICYAITICIFYSGQFSHL